MLFLAKSAIATCLAALALQAHARPVASGTVMSMSHKDSYISPEDMPSASINSTSDLQRREEAYTFIPSPDWVVPDNVQFAAGGRGGKSGFADLILLAVNAIKNKVQENKEKDLDARRQLTSDALDEMIARFPGWNAFVYIESKNFEYWIEDINKGFFTTSVDYTRKDGTLKKERYAIVAFVGRGHLDKNGYDGGFENWAYLMGERNDQTVDWY